MFTKLDSMCFGFDIFFRLFFCSHCTRWLGGANDQIDDKYTINERKNRKRNARKERQEMHSAVRVGVPFSSLYERRPESGFGGGEVSESG